MCLNLFAVQMCAKRGMIFFLGLARVGLVWAILKRFKGVWLLDGVLIERY